MKTFLKFLAVAMGLLLIGLAVGGIFFSFQAQEIVRAGIEKALTQTLGGQVMIDALRLYPMQRKLELIGVTVSNPTEFSQGTAFGCEKVTVVFDVRSFVSGTPTIELIAVQGPRLNIRHEVGKGTNVRKLTATPHGNKEEKNEPRFLVKELRCSETETTVSTNVIPGMQPNFSIAPVTLTNIGEGKAIGVGETGVIILRTLLENLLPSLLKPLRDSIETENATPSPDVMQPIIEQP